MLLRILTHDLKWDFDHVRGKSTVESREMRHTVINPDRVSSIVFNPDDVLDFARMACGTQIFWVDITTANLIIDHINGTATEGENGED